MFELGLYTKFPSTIVHVTQSFVRDFAALILSERNTHLRFEVSMSIMLRFNFVVTFSMFRNFEGSYLLFDRA